MSDNYFIRVYNAILGKQYAKQIEKPKEENRGASWNSVGGVQNTFSAQKSMDAFGIHGYTHAGVKRLSQDLAALPLKLIKGYGDKAVEIMDHPVLDLLRMPTTDTDEFLFREQITIDLVLSGNCYILLLGSSERPVSMVRLHPEEVKIVTDQQKGLIGYEHNSSGSVVVYPPDRVIHGKNAGYQKGNQSLYGCGSIQPLARELDADLNSQKLVSEATQKGRPDVLLSPKEDGDIWNKEVRRQILDQYSGMQKSGGAMVLSGQVNVDLLQLSPREMEFQASRTFARESISAVLGIPPSVLGLPTANYALGRQQAIEYWSNQIKRGKRIGLLFTRIARLWEEDLHFEHDYSEVEALQSVRDAKLLRVEKHVFMGISPEVAYAAEGLEYPRAQKEAQDIGEEEEENVRLLRLFDQISQDNYTDEVKLFSSEYRSDIEVVNVPSNPQVQEEEEILKSILGLPPNWRDYQEAHLFFNSNQDQMKEGYYIRIGRRLNTDDILNAAPETGKIAIFKDLLDLAVDHLNGRFGRPPITEEERRSAYQIIVQYFDVLKMSAPALLDSYLEFDSKKKDQKSLSESEWITFDIGYAEKLRLEYPEIWNTDSSLRSNEQYRKLSEGKSISAIQQRERWLMRHANDTDVFLNAEYPININTISPIISQIKYLAVGSLGQTKMKRTINKVKRQIDTDKKKENRNKRLWNKWIKNSQGKAEKDLLRAFKSYLSAAKNRYAKRINETKTKSIPIVSRAEEFPPPEILDKQSLLDLVNERKELQKAVGDKWLGWWMLTGNQQLEEIYRKAGKEKPQDLIFGNRDYGKKLWNDSVMDITSNTGKEIARIVQQGLENGLSTEEIALNLKNTDQSGIFDLGRANRIARTEATRVVNESTVESYKQLGKAGIQVKKQWLSARDGKVRPSHAALDGQTVGSNEDFVLPAEYGSHKAASPAGFDQVGENVNCRCTVIPIIVD
jgi:HK97 family phage portal protein